MRFSSVFPAALAAMISAVSARASVCPTKAKIGTVARSKRDRAQPLTSDVDSSSVRNTAERLGTSSTHSNETTLCISDRLTDGIACNTI
jgi:hypothetical protein